ncbi:hypothetical protein C0995_002592, partial [Termitomyces sp. Mi166
CPWNVLSFATTQYCDGLRGAFVVYDLLRLDPHRHLYDVDNVITLADWYHFPAPQAPVIAIASSTLINGKGRHVGGPSSPLSVISVVKGQRYRFRLTIIEVDGQNVQPLKVDSIQIFAGQRYSFVLEANQPISNYWPVPGVPTLGAADVPLNLAIAFDFASNKFSVNGASFVPPTVPVLLQILSGAKTAQDLLPPGSIYTLPRNKVIESPFLVRCDVVSTGGSASDNVTIRFIKDNSGPWIFHWDALCPAFDAAHPDG